MKKWWMGIIVLLLLLQTVAAETQLLTTQVTVSKVNSTLTIEAPLSSRAYDLNDDFFNGTTQTFSFSYTADVMCREESFQELLMNYTGQVVDVCKVDAARQRKCDDIFTVNGEMSSELGYLRGVNDSYIQTLATLETTSTSKEALQEKYATIQAENEKLKSDKDLYGFGGAILGAFLFWLFAIRLKGSQSRLARYATRNHANYEEPSYPSRLNDDAPQSPSPQPKDPFQRFEKK